MDGNVTKSVKQLCVGQYSSCIKHLEVPFHLSVGTLSMGYVKTSFISRPSHYSPRVLGG